MKLPDDLPSNLLLQAYLKLTHEIEKYRHVLNFSLNGKSLTIGGLTAASRYGVKVVLNNDNFFREQIYESRKTLLNKIDTGISVYGVNTGFGGSADTRTRDHTNLGNALFQMQHCGILPTSRVQSVLPLSSTLASLSMPEAWVRAAIMVRMNSLIRGHSGVRWEVLEALENILEKGIIPLVPLRGSISASGDLSPLSYIAGTIIGNPRIKILCDQNFYGWPVLSADAALTANGLKSISLQSKEHLGLLNGTAFSAAVAGLALFDAIQLALLIQICTAMSTEGLNGSKGSFDPFIHNVARPHPGQIEAATVVFNTLTGSQFAIDPLQHGEKSIGEDKGTLKQDRYSIRTAPQFIGPQIEDIHAALLSIQQELNSTTDNPLIDSATTAVHDTGNFQAMAVTNAMEKTRLSLHHLGKILFAQATELMDPHTSKGLPPSLAATDPSLDYHCKGLDIALAAYVSELGYLANPVSTHIQSAEMHNQSVNSLALISARATVTSLEVLTMIVATTIYVSCQAFDIRAIDITLKGGFEQIILRSYESLLDGTDSCWPGLLSNLISSFNVSFFDNPKKDAEDRVDTSVRAIGCTLMEYAFSGKPTELILFARILPELQQEIKSACLNLIQGTREMFLKSEPESLPTSRFLGKSRFLYEYVRKGLGIRMRGLENLNGFDKGLNATEPTTGENVSLIYEAIRDHKMHEVLKEILY
ncbi:hypothetical protein M422DRAFT_242089 [Sphaerobolus stellatus SS14]|nr:hypothetical protein M422DRAFT_242089 [Sphaerobolus stellatus SS14]